MIELYYWPTPNGHKITLFLEESGLPYSLEPVDISAGAQFAPEFLGISPNNKMPAIVDRDPADGGPPQPLFESGAILIYLAEKTGQFLGGEPQQRLEVLQWLFWQVAGFGPMLGQNHHFSHYAPEKIPYAIDRYAREARRLYGVLDRLLATRDFMAGAYSIADMATYPWALMHERQGVPAGEIPHVRAWIDRIAARPATQRAYARADEVRPPA